MDQTKIDIKTLKPANIKRDLNPRLVNNTGKCVLSIKGDPFAKSNA
jgi:hypothetical protein